MRSLGSWLGTPSRLMLALGMSVAAASTAHAANPPAFYESFAGHEISALNPANSTFALGVYTGNATNIATGDGFVFFQDGADIYRANPDLTGVTLWHSNLIAPTDIAYGNGIFYESFAGHEVAALNAANPTYGLGVYTGNATNITAGDGFVFFQDGADIYRANADLTGVTLWRSSLIAPTDIAYGNGIFYDSFAGHEIAALNAADPTYGLGVYTGNATNIATGDGFVFFQDEADIYRANADLTGVTLWHPNLIATADIAYLSEAPPPAPGVPEPASWALLICGFALAGVSLRRRLPTPAA